MKQKQSSQRRERSEVNNFAWRKEMRTVRRSMMLVIIAMCMLFTNAAWAIQFTYDYPVFTSVVAKSGTKGLRFFAANKPMMLKVADPALHTMPFQDEYGTIHVPLGYADELIIHVNIKLSNDKAAAYTLTGLVPDTWTQMFKNASGAMISANPQYSAPDKKDIGMFFWHRTFVARNTELLPGASITFPFFDLTLNMPFSVIPGWTTSSGSMTYKTYQLQVGDYTWADPTCKAPTTITTPVTTTTTATNVGDTVPADVVTQPTDPGQNVVPDVVTYTPPPTVVNPDPTTTLIDLIVDIKPGAEVAAINRQSHGVTPIRILADYAYDITDIDPATMLFAGTLPVKWHLEDDGLMLFYDTQRCIIANTATVLTVIGKTKDGRIIQGSDSVKVVK